MPTKPVEAPLLQPCGNFGLDDPRHLRDGVRRVEVAREDVSDRGVVPADDPGGRGQALSLEREAHRPHGRALGHGAEDPPHHLHVRLGHLESAAVFTRAVAVGGLLPFYDEAAPALLQKPVLGALGYLFPLPLGELVLHRVAEPVASIVQSDQLHPSSPRSWSHKSL